MMRKVALLVSLMFISAAVYAADIRPYIGIKAGIANINSNQVNTGTADITNSKNKFFGAAAIGAQYKALRAELEYGFRDIADYKGDNGFDQQMQSYLANIYFDFPTTICVKPFVTAGAGFSNIEIKNGVDSNRSYLFTYAVGAGITWAVNDNINIDAGYRFVKADKMSIDNVDIDNYSHDVYAGLRYTFGKSSDSKKAEEEARKAAAEAAAKAKAEKDAAEAAAKAQKEAADRQAEEARMQAELAKANAEKSMDQKRAEAEERRSKPSIKSFSLNMASFDTGKATLTQQSKKDIAAQAEDVKKFEYNKITIEGHTDATGNEKVNQKLSEARAKAVYDEFVKAGIPAEKMEYVGFASSMPVDSNKTTAGRAKNRRVEIFVE